MLQFCDLDGCFCFKEIACFQGLRQTCRVFREELFEVEMTDRQDGLKVAIRADGGDAVGLGHLSRCVSLAEAISRHAAGASVEFWCRQSAEAAGFLSREGFGINIIETPENPRETKKGLERYGPDVLILDLAEHVSHMAFEGWTEIDRDYSGELASIAPLSVQLDDFADGAFETSMVINGGIVPEYTEYAPGGSAEIFCGPEYALMRPEFAVANRKVRTISNRVSKILIIDPGHRFSRLVPRFLHGIEKHVDEPKVTLVSRGYSENPNRISSALDIYLKPSVPDMSAAMMESDIAISGGGVTVYELAATGTPAIIAPAIERQKPMCETYDRLGIALNTGPKPDYDDAADLLERLAGNLELRKSMMKKGRATVDGLGADRVAELIIERAGGSVPREEP